MVTIDSFLSADAHLGVGAFVEFGGIGLGIFDYFFLHQAVHACIGFNECAIHSLPFATYHAYFYTQAQHFTKEFQEYFFALQLPGAADGGVPG